jgi:hypothetical protein
VYYSSSFCVFFFFFQTAEKSDLQRAASLHMTERENMEAKMKKQQADCDMLGAERDSLQVLFRDTLKGKEQAETKVEQLESECKTTKKELQEQIQLMKEEFEKTCAELKQQGLLESERHENATYEYQACRAFTAFVLSLFPCSDC